MFKTGITVNERFGRLNVGIDTQPKEDCCLYAAQAGGGSAGLYEWLVAELGLAIFGSDKVSKTLVRTELDSPQVLANSDELLLLNTGFIAAITYDMKRLLRRAS